MRPVVVRVLVVFCMAFSFSWRAHADDQTKARAYAAYAGGVAFLNARKFEEAINLFQEALRLKPAAPIYFELGNCYRGLFSEQQNPEHARTALANYQEFIKQADPKLAESARLRAQAEREVLSLLAVLARLPPEPATAAPAPPPPPTELLITSPTSAQVFLDDETQGEPTPFSRVVQPGRHHARVTAPGFQAEERDLQAVEGRMIFTEIRLQPAPGRLDVGAEGGRVYVDGLAIGNAPLQRSGFSPGEHEVGIVQRGHQLWLEKVAVEADKTTHVTAQLQPTLQHKIAIYSALTGGATLLAGTVLGAMALVADSSLGQPGTDDASHRSYNDRLSTRNHLATASTVVLSTAVGLLAAAAGLHWFDMPDAPPVPASPSSEVTP